MSTVRPVLLMATLVALAWWAGPAWSQESEKPSGDEGRLALESSGRPDPEAGPTRVEVDVFVNDVKQIRDVEQTWSVDLWLDADWLDPRLADAEAPPSRSLGFHEVWHPDLQVVNLAGAQKQLPEMVTVSPAGRCFYVQRWLGTVSFDVDLHDFPFDTQLLHVDIVALFSTPQEVQLVLDGEVAGRATSLSIVDWDVGELQTRVAPMRVREGGPVISGLRLEMVANRYADYFMFKVILPLVIIIAMSFAVFWVDPSVPAPRIGMGTTSLLTLIAYRFLLGNLVPRVSYLTRLDVFIFGATLLVFLSLVVAITSNKLAHEGAAEKARRLDRCVRWIAPSVLVVLFLAAFL